MSDTRTANQRLSARAGRVSEPLLVVDSYAKGLSIGKTSQVQESGLLLQVEGEKGTTIPLRSRYVMHNGEPLKDLERHLERLSVRGELRRTTVVFGVTTDPFHPFDEKFATSMRFLELFERFVPGRLVIQTRSPLVVIGLPVLKKMKAATSVMIGLETPLEEVRARYTPDLPSVDERLKTVRALRRFGLKVGIQVAPILPYGDWRRDAEPFAELLNQSADYVVVRSVVQASGASRPTTALARRLAADRQFFCLRQDSHRPLLEALCGVAEEKLVHPAEQELGEKQMRLFATCQE
jgi:DNA repair photolyase